MLEREGASGGAALRHVEQVPGGGALQPYAIRPATVCDPPCNSMRSALHPCAIRPATLRRVEQVPGRGGLATSTKHGKRGAPNHHAKRTAANLNAPG